MPSGPWKAAGRRPSPPVPMDRTVCQSASVDDAMDSLSRTRCGARLHLFWLGLSHVIDPGVLGCRLRQCHVPWEQPVVRLQLIATAPLLQWTGSGLSLETGCPRKPNKDNSFRTHILCLRGKEGWGSSKLRALSCAPTTHPGVCGLGS